GEFAATLLANYISNKNYWLLKHHQYFLDVHARNHPDLDTAELEKFRGHPFFEHTAEWVRRYDQNSIQSSYDTAPLEFFEPMVKNLFSRPSKGKILNS
ncbi:MAG: phosphohydrolase, partial [SAR324 cluster bacterium]|nr:phosphohydrolase [SAR324 cluster bacterium]